MYLFLFIFGLSKKLFYWFILFKFYPAPGAEVPLLGIDTRSLKNFIGLWMVLNISTSQILAIFDKTDNFFPIALKIVCLFKDFSSLNGHGTSCEIW